MLTRRALAGCVAGLLWVWPGDAAGRPLRELLPEGPVVDAEARRAILDAGAHSPAVYTGGPRVPLPVLPLLGWGAAYEVDLVIASDHPDWDMHELAMLRTPDGPVWLAKDARAGTLEQLLVADIDGIDQWMPELPVRRKSGPVEVVDRSTERVLDLAIAYENHDGEAVAIGDRGPKPQSRRGKRNGSTMGHSQDAVVAVLDIPHLDLARRASVSIGGEGRPLRRVAGLVPFAMALEQAQGGLAVGAFVQEPLEDGGSWTRHVLPGRPDAGGEVSLEWRVESTDEALTLHTDSGFRSLHYRFVHRVDGPGVAWELARIEVRQWGREAPVTVVQFAPPLPDLRRPFSGVHTSRFVVDLNGQLGHAIGRVETSWRGDRVRVDLRPEAPWWVADRPMRTDIGFEGPRARVQIERLP